MVPNVGHSVSFSLKRAHYLHTLAIPDPNPPGNLKVAGNPLSHPLPAPYQCHLMKMGRDEFLPSQLSGSFQTVYPLQPAHLPH